MSDYAKSSSQIVSDLNRLSARYDAADKRLDDIGRMRAEGESVDHEEFMRLLETRVAAGAAMQAQFKLHEKPLKTVLNESK